MERKRGGWDGRSKLIVEGDIRGGARWREKGEAGMEVQCYYMFSQSILVNEQPI